MSGLAEPILADLRQVDAERTKRATTPGLVAKVDAIKRYQQRRFSLSYEQLLASDRYGPAARFFLEELYGPRDFSDRDAQFAKVVPSIVRFFPQSVLETVAALARLHALSERLDTTMGSALPNAAVDARSYLLAWQRCGEPAARQRQIEMTVELGRSLDRLTRKPLLRKSLRMMRGPAHAAGLGELQQLLERGFDAFGAMRGAQEFLEIVGREEQRLARSLFAEDQGDGRATGLP
jgi:hypothetical protein